MRHLAKVGPMFPCNKCNKSIEKPRSNEEFRDSLPEAWGPWEWQHAPHYRCRMLQKDRVLVSKIWSTRYWFWSGLSCIATASNPWRIVHIQLLATVGWKRGCQPFSCRCSQNVMHCRKEMCWTCLFQESMPFVKSKPPLPTRSLSFLRAAYVPPSLH